MADVKGVGAAATGGAIGLLGDLTTTFLNRYWSKKDYERNKADEQAQFERNAALEQKQYDRNRADYLADLQSEREYNSAQSQINRLKAAGLNPNLMNGGSLSAGQSSAAQMQGTSTLGTSLPSSIGASASFSSIPSSANAIASGLAASSNAEVNVRKADAEIANIKASTEYKNIENSFLVAEKRLALKASEQSIQESLAKCKDYASQISLRDNTIVLNGHKIKLIDNQASKAEQDAMLSAARQALTNLDVQKMKLIMPYVQAYEEAKIVNLNARSDAAKQSAFLSYHQAEIAALEAFKQQGLLDAGLVDAEISRLNAEIEVSKTNVKYAKVHARNDSWRTAANMVDAVGKVTLGTAGIIIGLKAPSFPQRIKFGGNSWNYK